MRTTSFLVAIMAIAITACDKESFTPAIPSIDRSLYTEFSEPAEKVETFTAVLRDKELSVTGITVSHSHYNDLTFKAAMKDINSGSVTNVTDKATWHIPAIYSMRATKGIERNPTTRKSPHSVRAMTVKFLNMVCYQRKADS